MWEHSRKINLTVSALNGLCQTHLLTYSESKDCFKGVKQLNDMKFTWIMNKNIYMEI